MEAPNGAYCCISGVKDLLKESNLTSVLTMKKSHLTFTKCIRNGFQFFLFLYERLSRRGVVIQVSKRKAVLQYSFQLGYKTLEYTPIRNGKPENES